MYIVLENYHKGLVKKEVIYGKKEEVISFFRREKERDWGIDEKREYVEEKEMFDAVEELKERPYLKQRKTKFLSV